MNESDKIRDNIMMQVEITCTKCGRTDTDFSDEFYFSEKLIKEGWRATLNNIYCPYCALILKPKKIKKV